MRELEAVRARIERLVEENRKLMKWALMVSDLDRCEHGRHEGDTCFDCTGDVSVGNTLLPPGTVIGHDISGRPYTVPERRKRHDPEEWKR